jgi:hypothetical protein
MFIKKSVLKSYPNCNYFFFLFNYKDDNYSKIKKKKRTQDERRKIFVMLVCDTFIKTRHLRKIRVCESEWKERATKHLNRKIVNFI